MAERSDSKPRSRHIPQAVVSELLKKARDRCCLCRVLIDPETFDDDALFGSLEKHHIHQFSEGGGHTYENLLLVCANCHAQIHKHPEKYPLDELRQKKRHWVKMVSVVPNELQMSRETEDAISIPFLVMSLNLRYAILASPQATIAELALFVGENILKPLGEYDDRGNWLEPEKVWLARGSASKKLDPGLHLGEVQLSRDDVLTARVPKIVVPVEVPPFPDIGTRKHPLAPELVTIPAGRFWMGTNRRRLERAGLEWGDHMEIETPCHQVHLPRYEIGKYPVTNAQYGGFVRSTGHRGPYDWKHGKVPHDKEDHPVVGVSWDDAIAYCRWLSKKTGRQVILPSEAEWEKAARGTDGRIYPWGDNRPTADLCNFDGNVGSTTPVGRYSPQGDSPYDCADMAGNVWEWMQSAWGTDWRKPSFGYPYGPEDGRENLDEAGLRVLRGGSFFSSVFFVRCAGRLRYYPNYHWYNVGFRVVVAPFSPTSKLRYLASGSLEICSLDVRIDDWLGD